MSFIHEARRDIAAAAGQLQCAALLALDPRPELHVGVEELAALTVAELEAMRDQAIALQAEFGDRIP